MDIRTRKIRSPMSKIQILSSEIARSRRWRIAAALALLTSFDLLLLAYRLKINGLPQPVPRFSDSQLMPPWMTTTFMFLLWNLFLAWLPYLAALRFGHLARRREQVGWLRLATVFMFWLAFFPNAPYILTDFVHFKSRPPVPVWLDLMLLFSSAFTGLMLGLFSLFEIQMGLRRWISARWAFFFTLPAIVLCGFGIWLGRFYRFNSWDVVSNPSGLFRGLFKIFTTPSDLVFALKITGCFSGLLLLGYLILLAAVSENSSQK